MILVDTSAWVEFDRATTSPADRRLTELIAGDGPIAVTEPIIMEVVAGARDAAREHDRPCEALWNAAPVERFSGSPVKIVAEGIEQPARRVVKG